MGCRTCETDAYIVYNEALNYADRCHFNYTRYCTNVYGSVVMVVDGGTGEIGD